METTIVFSPLFWNDKHDPFSLIKKAMLRSVKYAYILVKKPY